MKESEQVPTITRRTFLGTAAALVTGLPQNILPAVEGSQTPEYTDEEAKRKTQKLIRDVQAMSTVEDRGYRISDAWLAEDGMWYIAYQGIVFQENPVLGTVPDNTLDKLHQMGLDAYLEAIYQIPPHVDVNDGSTNIEEAVERRFEIFNIGERQQAWTRRMRAKFEIGAPTSPPKDYGPFINARYQRAGYQFDKATGQERRILVGDIAANVGRKIAGKFIPGKKIIPDRALLPSPDLSETEPTPTPTPPETSAPPEAEETLEEKIIRVIGKGDKKEVQDILKNLAEAKAIAARDKSTMDIIEADGEYLLYRSITGRIKGYYYATGNPEILEILAQIREMARGHRRFDEKDWKITVGGKEIEY